MLTLDFVSGCERIIINILDSIMKVMINDARSIQLYILEFSQNQTDFLIQYVLYFC